LECGGTTPLCSQTPRHDIAQKSGDMSPHAKEPFGLLLADFRCPHGTIRAPARVETRPEGV